jgi:hypothetical protein
MRATDAKTNVAPATPAGELLLTDNMQGLTLVLSPLLALWEERREEGGFPLRSAFSPRDLKAWLPGIHVYEAVENQRFTARLLGTAIVTAIGADQTGRTFGEHDQDLLAARAFRVLSLVVKDRKPYRTQTPRIAAVKQSWHSAESLWLPLGADGKVQQILAATVLTSLG